LNPREHERGVALVLALALIILLESLAAVTAATTLARIRLSGDEHLAIEAGLTAASALADARVRWAAPITALADGATVDLAQLARSDGWQTDVAAERTGVLIRLTATAVRPASGGGVMARRRITLLLVRLATDTVRVLGRGARF
jgi:hypothetical protein